MNVTGRDLAEATFRLLFALIFIGLGFEHIFSDALLQRLMPSWVPFARTVSILCGIWLIGWGLCIVLGCYLRHAAVALGGFVAIVTVAVHVPGVISCPVNVAGECRWMWDILQRSNLAKNFCLIGVCCELLFHQPGRLSVGYRHNSDLR